MTIHTRIVKEPIDNIDFESGFNGNALDDEHTLIWCSDHPMADPPKDAADLDAFVSDYETVDSHPNESNAGGELSTDGNHPNANPGTFPDNAEFDAERLPTEAVENGRIIWERF